ncbi:MAG TPA: aldo/keto reductase, partial [Parapedobacter sp.]|nr:aldo/keto reductase [Parapedobacter sp.]
MSIINKIGIGTVQFGMDYGVSNRAGRTSLDEVDKILEYAQRMGINLLDTARSYGDAEAVLGASGAAAEGFNIVSKFMPSKTDGSVSLQFQQACQKLKTDRLYAYLSHRPLSLLDNNKEDWAAAQLLKTQNRVQKIGVSLNDPEELDRLNGEG